MLLATSVLGSRVTQRFGPAVAGVASQEPSMYATADIAYWLPFAGAQYYPHFHPGIDEAAAEGTPVVAVEAGTVIVAGWVSSASGNGVRVQIRPGTVYGGSHFAKVSVRVGQQVVKGQTIATVGRTGATTGPHTHRFLEITDSAGRRLIYDPSDFAAGGKWANDARIQPGAPAPAPAPPTSGVQTLLFAAGTYTGCKFSAAGAIVATKPHTLTRASSAPSSQRSMIKNQTGYWYFITAGIWAGYWIKESPGITPAGSVTPTPAPPASTRLVTLAGPGANIRTTPDLDNGYANLFASSQAGGIYAFPSGARIHANIYTGFALRRELSNDDGAWVEVYGFGRVLFIHRSVVNISK